MVHAEELVLNPVKGCCAWALRHIPSGKYGDPYDWSLVIVREDWDSQLVEVKLCEGMTLSKRRAIEKKILDMGFIGAKAREGGKEVIWLFKGPRKILKMSKRSVTMSVQATDGNGDTAIEGYLRQFFGSKEEQLAFQAEAFEKTRQTFTELSLGLKEKHETE